MTYEYGESHKFAGFSHVQDSEEVEPLVICLLEQVMDEAFVSFEPTYASQMPTHSTHHTGHASNSLKENKSIHPPHLSHPGQVIASSYVIDSPEELDSDQSHFISQFFGLHMGDGYLLRCLFGVDVMG